MPELPRDLRVSRRKRVKRSQGGARYRTKSSERTIRRGAGKSQACSRDKALRGSKHPREEAVYLELVPALPALRIVFACWVHFTNGHSLPASGRKASSPGMVFMIL